MNLDKLIEWVGCEKDCSCHGHEAARRFRLAVDTLRRLRVAVPPTDFNKVCDKALREIEGSPTK